MHGARVLLAIDGTFVEPADVRAELADHFVVATVGIGEGARVRGVHDRTNLAVGQLDPKVAIPLLQQRERVVVRMAGETKRRGESNRGIVPIAG